MSVRSAETWRDLMALGRRQVNRYALTIRTEPLGAPPNASAFAVDTAGRFRMIDLASKFAANINELPGLLDGLDLGLYIFDDEDRTLAWNETFLRFFPEHAAHVRAGEPYRENLLRFYRARLSGEELPFIEDHIARGIARHCAVRPSGSMVLTR